MLVYIVLEEVTYHYDDGRTYKSVYGVYDSLEKANAAKKECLAQVGGDYFASIEEMMVK